MKTYSGFTTDTADSLLLDAGAFFKNFTIGTDTYESAVTAGKLIGATSGGGNFSAIPEIRSIPIDGVKGRAKGLEVLDAWEASIKATLIEITPESLKLTLGAADIDDQAEAYGPSTAQVDLTSIKGRNQIELTDYVDNITWIGTLSGSDTPVIIQIYNALSIDGLNMDVADKSETTTEVTFYAHYTQADLNTPPFAIYYPED